MSQIWQDKKLVPVTIIKAEPNTVTLVRTNAKDGYSAVQVALGKTKREFRVSADPAEAQRGNVIDVSAFKEGDVVRISSISKGHGFQGVVKRHGFAGGPKTHGQKNRFRAPGSIGSTAPQKVFPGRRMAGHMGNKKITVKNLKVVEVDKEKNWLLLKGAVPGASHGLVEIEKIR